MIPVTTPFWPWLNDIAAVALLVWLAMVLYFSQTTRLGLSMDGFLLTYLKQTGDLLAYNVVEIKEPGRPFVGLGWHLAALVTGGTVTGYNAFQASCLTASALLVYAFARTLLPRQPVWALLAGILKLVWCANYEVFDNSGLQIYFAEALFWLDCCLLATLALRRQRLSKFEVSFASSLMAASLLVVVGTYQTAWPVVALLPVALLVSGVLPWPTRWWVLALWYLAVVPAMAWCYSLSRHFVSIVAVPAPEVARRVWTGLWASTGQALISPFAGSTAYLRLGVSRSVVIALVVFVVLLVWMGMQSWPALSNQPRKLTARQCMLIVLIGVTVALASVMPPSLIYVPAHGTRFMHWASAGTIAGVVAAIAALYRLHRWAGGIGAVIIATTLVAGMTQLTSDIGNHYARNGFLNRRFWEDVSVELPKLDEGTVVLMAGPPHGISTVDVFSTWLLRALTETHVTYFITDGTPRYDPHRQAYDITSMVDVTQSEPVVPPSRYLRYPTPLGQPRTFQVPIDRVVWVEWNVTSRRLRVIPARSAMTRVQRNVPSVFGQLLFPRSTVEYDRGRRGSDPPL